MENCLKLGFVISLLLLSIKPIDASQLAKPTVFDETERVVIEWLAPDNQATSMYVRYGFNGWDLDFSGATEDYAYGSIAYRATKEMKFDAESATYRIEIDKPTNAKALHYVFCRNACESGDWFNNSGLDYHYSFEFPLMGPVLTWGTDQNPETELTVSIKDSRKGRFWLQLKSSDKQEWGSRTYAQRDSDNWYRFKLNWMKFDAGSEVSYRMGVGDEVLSSDFQLRVPDNKVIDKKVRFAVFGDVQDDGRGGRTKNTMKALAKLTEDLDFIISTGDLAWNDHPGDWWTFFDLSKNVLSRIPFMPSIGNHDTPGNNSNFNADSFVRQFSLPDINRDKTFYRFRYGNTRFLALNSDRVDELQAFNQQFSYAEDWANPEKPTKWNFAYWHIGPLNIGARHWRQMYIGRQLSGLLSERTDMIFNGHEHLYQRFDPVSVRYEELYEPILQNSAGLRFVTVPPAGAFPEGRVRITDDAENLRELLAFPKLDNDQEIVEAFNGFVIVTVTTNKLLLETYKVDGGEFSVVDRLSYAK